MQFPSMGGSIFNSMKLMELKTKWNIRKENPFKKKDENPQVAQFRERAENIRKSNIISALDGKLKAGAELTPDEMDYLRINNPELYKQALEVQLERKQYKKSLSNCKTKEDVDEVKSQKLQQFLAETRTIKSNPNIPTGEKQRLMDQVTRKLMGIQDEHTKFIKSQQYKELPREAELRAEKARKKQKKRLDDMEETEDQSVKDSFDSLLKALNDSDISILKEASPDQIPNEAVPSSSVTNSVSAGTYDAKGNIFPTPHTIAPDIDGQVFQKA